LGELQINVGRFCCKCTCYDLFNMASGLASQLEFLFFLKLYSLFLSVNWLSVDRNSSKQRERVKMYSKANHWSYELVREKENVRTAPLNDYDQILLLKPAAYF